jgi:hypothetical protein
VISLISKGSQVHFSANYKIIMARSLIDLPSRDSSLRVQQEASADQLRTFLDEDISHVSQNNGFEATSGTAVVRHPEFLPPPGCFPAYKFGPEPVAFGHDGSSISRFFDSACHSMGPSALNNATLFLDRQGMFDHLLYNYMFMCTVNKASMKCSMPLNRSELAEESRLLCLCTHQRTRMTFRVVYIST